MTIIRVLPCEICRIKHVASFSLVKSFALNRDNGAGRRPPSDLRGHSLNLFLSSILYCMGLFCCVFAIILWYGRKLRAIRLNAAFKAGQDCRFTPLEQWHFRHLYPRSLYDSTLNRLWQIVQSSDFDVI